MYSNYQMNLTSMSNINGYTILTYSLQLEYISDDPACILFLSMFTVYYLFIKSIQMVSGVLYLCVADTS